tara:strand:+ start:824 stop:1165 length:342 start_codon:yes stop_codon:yes gene_type:complete
MKLNNIHILLLIVAILVFANLGMGIKEGLEVKKQSIPKEDSDSYILKSEIVPPVCPRCPDVTACPKMKAKCPACPPCGRCPAAPFECKKVPNYKSSDQDYLPRPLLNDFSQFV